LKNTRAFSNLAVGRTVPSAGGTDGWLTEFRIWDSARTPNEIRDNLDRGFAGERPKGLIHHLTGKSWGKLSGNARVMPSLDAPTLLTAAQARAQREKFAKFRALAEKPGNLERGKELFTSICLNCHSLGGTGGQISPALDGVGLTGTEALLRNILTPNVAMEGGYRTFRVETEDLELLDGFLVSQDAKAIVLRQPNTADRRIPKEDVTRAGFTANSLMPGGLLEALKPQQVSDLFTFLKSLK
ncbi:MAG: c-type cytochrome, partial [Pirellulaceae bacterium]|nr:c-type cytochrome [Pirellulaceae bacterium]